MSRLFKIFLLVVLSVFSALNLSANETFFSIEKSSERIEELVQAGSDLAALLTKQKNRLQNLKNQYGNLDFSGFTPIGGKTTNDISSSMYNEMFADLGSRTTWTTSKKTNKIIEVLG